MRHFYVVNILVIYSHLCIKNLKWIRGELTELWQFYWCYQTMLYFLVWQIHVKKTITCSLDALQCLIYLSTISCFGSYSSSTILIRQLWESLTWNGSQASRNGSCWDYRVLSCLLSFLLSLIINFLYYIITFIYSSSV